MEPVGPHWFESCDGSGTVAIFVALLRWWSSTTEIVLYTQEIVLKIFYMQGQIQTVCKWFIMLLKCLLNNHQSAIGQILGGLKHSCQICVSSGLVLQVQMSSGLVSQSVLSTNSLVSDGTNFGRAQAQLSKCVSSALVLQFQMSSGLVSQPVLSTNSLSSSLAPHTVHSCLALLSLRCIGIVPHSLMSCEP